MPVSRCMDKELRRINTMEYYSAMKKGMELSPSE